MGCTFYNAGGAFLQIEFNVAHHACVPDWGMNNAIGMMECWLVWSLMCPTTQIKTDDIGVPVEHL